jgi:ferredoxin
VPQDLVKQHEVHIANCGESYPCREDQTLLAGMEALGRKGIPIGCRGGGCGICKVHVRSGEYRAGKMSRACVSEEEQARRIALACRIYPRSDVVLEAAGAATRRLAQQAEEDLDGETCEDRSPSSNEYRV